MIVARAYRLPVSVILAWTAVDVLIAAWDHARAKASDVYAQRVRSLNDGNMTAIAFHEPSKLRDEKATLIADEPAWEKKAVAKPSGNWDGFAAMAATMGVG